MKIAVTGATGFIGRYLVRRFLEEGHTLRCWYRSPGSRDGIADDDDGLTWIEGMLGTEESAARLVSGCEALVHAALWRPGSGFRGGEGDVVKFVQTNVVGSLQLFEAARAAGVERVVYLSTCAVHEEILEDRPLDEAHPLWPLTHYGAHKAAVEKFVHSYGLGEGYPICALRPTGVYGEAVPIQSSKWFDLIAQAAAGREVVCNRGGKEVHAADVAKATSLLLGADGIAGQAYSCYDRYISEYDVATIARELSGSSATIRGEPRRPRHQIETAKLRGLGMEFGGDAQLRRTIQSLVDAALSPQASPTGES